ncbi:PKD-like domain-containing protein [Flaviaesturariibacter amylovorans]|uniref:T9SS type A sorting domain-containing protein n=1 Tax=Flaviaesturariibacter amylovorans TaxID=1084520 RepID=A0ABP8GT68_9BACT
MRRSLFFLFLLAGFFRPALAQTGNVDLSYNSNDPGFGKGDGPDLGIYAMAPYGPTQTLVGGYFVTYNGAYRYRLALLNADGTLDPSFNAGSSVDGIVYRLVVQPDGKILVGGDFNNFNGIPHGGILRLNANGSIDNTFQGYGVDRQVNDIVLLPDGKILVAGDFTNYNGTAVDDLIRLNADGTLDNSFALPAFGSTTSYYLHTVKVLSNAKLLIGGRFPAINGIPRSGIARLNSDGTPDASWAPAGVNGSGHAEGLGEVRAIAFQADGQILLGGFIASYNGAAANNLVRINPDGSRDASLVGRTTWPPTRASAGVYCILPQADGKIMIGGDFTGYQNYSVQSMTRVLANGSIDLTFTRMNSFVARPVYAIRQLANGKYLAIARSGHWNGIVRGGIVRFENNGEVDLTYNTGGGASSYVFGILAHPNGKNLVTGRFYGYHQQYKEYMAWTNDDGSLVAGITGTTHNGWPNSVALQPNGKMIIGGGFTGYLGLPRANLARINPDGTGDPSFGTGYASGPNGTVHHVQLLPDGKALVSGTFSTYGGTPTGSLVRVNTDGTLDGNFNAGTGPNGRVRASIVQADGKVVIGGEFTTYNGTSARYIARINTDGSLDGTFNSGTGFDSWVLALAQQPDGRIVVGGYLRSYNNAPVKGLVRIGADGTRDAAFNPDFDYWPGALLVQESGHIVAAGDFYNVNGVAHRAIVRLRPDGTNDPSFSAGAGVNARINALTGLPNGDLLIGGEFTSVDGIGRNRVARLKGAKATLGALTATSFCTGTSITVPWTVTQAFAAGNTFTAQLSDANGSFANPTVLGSVNGTGSGAVTVPMPSVPSGSGYRVRVVASAPEWFTADNGADITIAQTTTTISYPTGPWCTTTGTGTVQLQGVTGGTFTASPAGLAIDAASGAIDIGASASGIYTVSYLSGACAVPVTTQVAVRPATLIQSQPNQLVCGGTQMPALAFGGAPGIGFAWTNSNTSIGLAADGAGNLPAFTAVNTSGVMQTASINVRITGGTGCTAKPMVFQIRVSPQPTMSPVGNQVVCAGNNSSPVTFSSTATGVTFVWTNSNPAIGLRATGGGHIPAFTVQNNTGTAQTGTITVTPLAGGCPGVPVSYSYTVHPHAASLSYAAASFCALGNARAQLTASGNGTWSVTPAGLTVSPWDGTLSLTGAATGNYTVSYTVPNTGGGCPNSASTNVTILPGATLANVPNAVYCNGAAVPPLSFIGTATGFSWVNSNTAIGLPAAGSGNIASFTATNTGDEPIYAFVRVTALGDGTSICSAKPETFRITVFPTPRVIDPGPQVFCRGTAVAPLTFSTPVPGTNVYWVNSSNSIGLYATSGGATVPGFTAQNPNPAGSGIAAASTLTVTPSANKCIGPSVAVAYTVNDCITGRGDVPSEGGTLRMAATEEIRVAPNPTNGLATVRWSVPGTWTVQLLGAYGQAIGRPVAVNGGTHTVDLTGLPAGMYRLQLQHVATGKSQLRSLVKL